MLKIRGNVWLNLRSGSIGFSKKQNNDYSTNTSHRNQSIGPCFILPSLLQICTLGRIPPIQLHGYLVKQ